MEPWVLSAPARAALGFIGFVYFAQWAIYKMQSHWFLQMLEILEAVGVGEGLFILSVPPSRIFYRDLNLDVLWHICIHSMGTLNI